MHNPLYTMHYPLYILLLKHPVTRSCKNCKTGSHSAYFCLKLLDMLKPFTSFSYPKTRINISLQDLFARSLCPTNRLCHTEIGHAENLSRWLYRHWIERASPVYKGQSFTNTPQRLLHCICIRGKKAWASHSTRLTFQNPHIFCTLNSIQ